MELEDILNGQAPEAEPVADVEEQAPEPQADGPLRDEQGRFAPKGETQLEAAPVAAPEAAPPAAERHSIPPEALAEERRKRQEAEQRLADFQRTQAPPQSLPQHQEQPAYVPPEYIPNPVDDPQGFYDAVMAQAVHQVRLELLPQVNQQIGQTRIETLREFAASKYPDFAQVETEYERLAQTNPAIRQMVIQSANPVETAYDLTKKHMEVQRLGSMDIEAIKAAAVQEYLAKAPQAQTAAPQAIPTSLADSQSARSGVVPSAPPTLDQILGR